MGERPTATSEESLFRAIPHRQTNRSPFEIRALAPALLSSLEIAAAVEGAWLRIVGSPSAKSDIADLVAEGDRIQSANRHFRRELAAWLHPNRTHSRDGMPGYAFGFGALTSHVGPLLIRTFDWGEEQAAKDHQIAAGSPILAVLGTNADSPADWLAAGQALDRVLLLARSEEVWTSFLNQPIEVPELRPHLGRLLGRAGVPQLLMRMGYGPQPEPTPRRIATDVLL